MRYPVVVIARQMELVADPIERRGFGISEMAAPRLDEEIKEDQVVRKTRKLEVAIGNYYRYQL